MALLGRGHSTFHYGPPNNLQTRLLSQLYGLSGGSSDDADTRLGQTKVGDDRVIIENPGWMVCLRVTRASGRRIRTRWGWRRQNSGKQIRSGGPWPRGPQDAVLMQRCFEQLRIPSVTMRSCCTGGVVACMGTWCQLVPMRYCMVCLTVVLPCYLYSCACLNIACRNRWSCGCLASIPR